MRVLEAFARVPFLSALLSSLNDEDRRTLAARAELRTLSRSEALWAEGQQSEELCFVVRGRVKMVKTSQSGRHVIMEMASPGELLCANATCAELPYCCASVCMEDGTEAVVLPRRDVMELVERSPEATRAFIREIARRGTAMCQRIEELAGVKVEQRVAMLLLKLADRAGHPLPDGGIRIPIPLSRQDVADMCGTTIESAIRVMSSLRKRDIVRSAARGFVVTDRELLEAIVQPLHVVGRRSVSALA